MKDKQIITQIATINDIDSFLKLQAKYLVTNLTQEQKKWFCHHTVHNRTVVRNY